MRTVYLFRTKDDGKQTIGELRLDALVAPKYCDTLERPWKGNQHKISCIPCGTYVCKKAYMNDAATFHYQVQNVLNRTGIFLHAGNYNTDSLGCILLGNGFADINKDGELDLLNTTATVKKFQDEMLFLDFQLIITAPPAPEGTFAAAANV